MKIFKLIFSISFLLLVFAGCKKDTYEDTSFVDANAAPAALSMLFEITHDNTGLVTITPTGENVATYDVYYGHGSTTAAHVNAGGNTTHNYPEGTFNVRVVAHSISGKTTEVTKQLTVSFRQPENLDFTITIDPLNNYKVSVSATALYETNFLVYFGDVPNEVGFSFIEGSAVSHTYAAIGTYNIKVVALSGGAASAQLIKPVTIVDPVLLPITFESPTVTYAWSDFGGGAVTKIANPQINGINTSATVGKMVKNAPEVYGGSAITLGTPIDFSLNKTFRMKVFSPRVGARALLKVENLTDGSISYEKEATSTVANAWEDLTFDYSAINTANSYQKVVLIFDLGTVGNGSANFTWLFDDIRLVNTAPVLELPLTFESSTLNYNWTGFDGGNVTILANPQSGGINTSAKVAKMVKSAGQTYGGAFLTLAAPINFSTLHILRMKVYSPRVGARVLLKVENATNGAVSFEKEVATTVANAWEDLSFDYTTINAANSYQKIVLIFDNGTMGWLSKLYLAV